MIRDILESLVRLAAADAERYARARQRNVMLYALVAVAGLTAYACLVVAGVLLVARWSSPVLAATFAAATFGALALVVIAVVAVLNRRERRWRQERRAVYSNALMTMTGAALGPRGLAWVSAAMIAGMVIFKPRSADAAPKD